jgi:uncharacterized membrane protein YGL010W
MTRIQPLFDRYAESHRHPVNQAIHWICVPLITWGVLTALWALAPAAAIALVVAAIVFYAWMSWPLALGMLAVTALMLAPLPLVPSRSLLAGLAAAVFVAAWVGQFVGHHIEGRKPSFLDDLTFLLVGPVWLLAFVYRRLGIGY